MPVAAADDLQRPGTGSGDGRDHLRPLVACISDQAFDEGEAPACLPQQILRAVAVLHAGRMDDDGQQQAKGVGQDMALAPEHLLARVIARGVERSAPFCAPLALWLSMIAAVGLASRPAASRTST